MKIFQKFFLLFLIIELTIVTSNHWLLQHDIDVSVLHIANVFLFLLHIATIALQIKAMNNKNPQVFVRSVMSSMLLKMLLSALSIIVYVFLNGEHFNEKSIFIALFLYLFYLSVEVVSLTNMNKKKNG
jgi:hypothetical protein